MQRPFHLMAKPTGSQCNLACDYCFYLDKAQSGTTAAKPRRHMDDKVLSDYVRQYIALNPAGEIVFSWQGGEPTLAGLAFFRRVLDYQRHYAGGKKITNCIQTNGVLIDKAWARFLADNRFLVGVSVDGPACLHDRYRKTHGGQSVFGRVTQAIDLLKRYQVEFNLLAVVNDETAREPMAVYRFLTQELGGRFIQFIPVVEQWSAGSLCGELIHPQSLADKQLTPWSVSGEAYGKFITTLFDYWVRHDVGTVFVQLFDNALAAWAGETPSLCIMRPTCGLGLVIEQNGDIYSCDHFVYPQHRLGNIRRDRLDALVYGKRQKSFSMQKAALTPACQQCDYRFVCRGGCPKHRIEQELSGWHNHLCAGYRTIFAHIDPYMRYMAQELRQRRPAANVMAVAAAIASQAAH